MRTPSVTFIPLPQQSSNFFKVFAAFPSPCGEHVYAWCSKSQIYKVNTSSLKATAVGGVNPRIQAISCSLNGEQFATVSQNGSIEIFNTTTQTRTKSLLLAHNITKVKFLSNNSLICSSANKLFIITKLNSDCPKSAPLLNAPDSISAIATSPCGREVAVAITSGTIFRICTKTGKQLCKELIAHNDTVFSLCYSRNGRNLFSGSGDNTIISWDLNQLQTLPPTILKSHNDSVSSLNSISENVIISGSYDHTVRFWDISTNSMVSSFKTLDKVTSIHYLHSKNKLYVCSGGSLLVIQDPVDISSSEKKLRAFAL